MAAPRRIAAVAVGLALAAAPPAAVAQNGAGDEQYEDPFAGGSQQPAAKPKPKQQPQQQQRQPTPVQPVPHQQLPSGSQPTPAQPGSTAATELPRTGFDVVPVALAGAALVIAGLVLLRGRRLHGRD